MARGLSGMHRQQPQLVFQLPPAPEHPSLGSSPNHQPQTKGHAGDRTRANRTVATPTPGGQSPPGTPLRAPQPRGWTTPPARLWGLTLLNTRTALGGRTPKSSAQPLRRAAGPARTPRAGPLSAGPSASFSPTPTAQRPP